jgi:hypothetical protein
VPQRVDVLERHDATDSPRLEREHMQGMQAMLPTGSRRVQGHCRLPIGRGTYDRGAAEREHPRTKESTDRRAALKPRDKRRHFKDRVLGQHCDQPVNVGVLKCGHIPVEQFTLPRLRRLHQRVAVCGQMRARPLQRTVHRRHAQIEQRRDFRCRPTQYLGLSLVMPDEESVAEIQVLTVEEIPMLAVPPAAG